MFVEATIFEWSRTSLNLCDWPFTVAPARAWFEPSRFGARPGSTTSPACCSRVRDELSLFGGAESGGAVEQPVVDDGVVEALVAAERQFVGVPVAGVVHDVAAVDRRDAGVVEAPATPGPDVVLVAVELEGLIGELLADLGGGAAHDRLALRCRGLGAGVVLRISVP